VPAPTEGFVSRIATTALGRAALHLGAGRATKDDVVDRAVGIVCHAKRRDRVEVGAALAEVHARDEASAERAVAEVAACYELGPEPPPNRPLVYEVVR
jgi:thymidine phosphorylase